MTLRLNKVLKRMAINITIYIINNITNINITNIPYHKIFNNSSIFTLQTRITEQQHIYNYLAAEK